MKYLYFNERVKYVKAICLFLYWEGPTFKYTMAVFYWKKHTCKYDLSVLYWKGHTFK